MTTVPTTTHINVNGGKIPTFGKTGQKWGIEGRITTPRDLSLLRVLCGGGCGNA
jgi:hypothetical protein